MTKILQILFCGLVVVAPWLFGAVTAKPQFYLALVLTPIALLRFVQRLFLSSETTPTGIPLVVFLGLGLLGIGVCQLAPYGGSSPLEMLQSAEMSDLLPSVTESSEFKGFARGLHTVSPVSTQLALSQLCLAILALWVSFDLFEDANSRRWLYMVLALNGAVMAGFGIAQKITWNGMLFWSVPLRYGGSPFGPFVNRNNAAGYLLLTFACAVACLVSAWFPFGLGPKKTQAISFRAQISQVLLRSLGQITPSVLIPLTAIMLIVGGLLSSLSRAGVVGLITCALVLIPALSRWRTRVLVTLTALICGAYGALVWVGENEHFASRVQTLGQIGKVAEGRLSHWREVFPLIRDVRWTGAGLGTYAKVSPLYLSENNDRWFQHAENQYVEILVETGIGGLFLFISGLLLFAYAAARAIRSDKEGRLLAAGIAGVLSVMAMATISLTDFSLAIGSVLLTFLTILGSVLASFSRVTDVSGWILLLRGSRLWTVLLQVALLLGSGVSFYQLHFAAEMEDMVDLLPTEDELPQLSVDTCDRILRQLNSRGIRHPEHPSLLNTAAQLKIYRYRRLMYDDLLKQPQSETLTPRFLWNLTHIERLDAVATGMDAEERKRLLESSEVRTNLPEALDDLKRSLKRDPLNRRTALSAAWLAHLLDDSSQSEMRDLSIVLRDLAMIVGASDSTALYQLGLLSERMNQPDANQRCWNRCLTISETWAQPIWDQATQIRDEREAMPILPDRLNTLLAISRLSRDLSVRSELLERCRQIADATPDLPARTRAELELQFGNTPKAIEAFLEAIQETPMDVDLRLETSLAMEKAGDRGGAIQMVEIAEALAPKRQDIKKRLRELTNTGPQSSAHRQDLPNSANAPKNR